MLLTINDMPSCSCIFSQDELTCYNLIKCLVRREGLVFIKSKMKGPVHLKAWNFNRFFEAIDSEELICYIQVTETP